VVVLIVDCRFDLLFPMAQGLKLAKPDYSPLFVALEFRNGLHSRYSDFFKVL